MFPPAAQAAADEVLGGGKFAPGYERTYWEGCEHGYAVRGDMVSVRMISLGGKDVTYSVGREEQPEDQGG